MNTVTLCSIDSAGAPTVQAFGAEALVRVPGSAVMVEWNGREYVLSDDGTPLADWLDRWRPDAPEAPAEGPVQGELSL